MVVVLVEVVVLALLCQETVFVMLSCLLTLHIGQSRQVYHTFHVPRTSRCFSANLLSFDASSSSCIHIFESVFVLDCVVVRVRIMLTDVWCERRAMGMIHREADQDNASQSETIRKRTHVTRM